MKTKTILILFSAFLLQSCFSGKEIKAAQSEFTEENEAIPAEFGSDENTVMVGILRHRNAYDKWVEKAFEDNYNGEYVLLYEHQLSEPEFSNKEKYRYIFDYSDGTIKHSTKYPSVTYKRFYVKDRLEDKMYQSGAEFYHFSKAMAVYVENLEKKRLSK